MNESLKNLLESARKIPQTDADREHQRRSFAFGNTHFENSLITREMVDKMADEIAASKQND